MILVRLESLTYAYAAMVITAFNKPSGVISQILRGSRFQSGTRGDEASSGLSAEGGE